MGMAMDPAEQVVEPRESDATGEGESRCVHFHADGIVGDGQSTHLTSQQCEHTASKSGSAPGCSEE